MTIHCLEQASTRLSTPDPLPQVQKDAPIASPPPTHPRAKAFQFCGVRVCYLKSKMKMGWGHDEGDCTSRTLFAISTIHEADKPAAWRIICGSHSLWLFFGAASSSTQMQVPPVD